MTTLIRDIMTKNPTYLQPTATLKDASEKMMKLDCGFIPVGDGTRLLGTITDRDITLAIAQGKDPTKTKLQDVTTVLHKILYCFEDDDVTKAATSMRDLQIHRLVVLNKDKRFTGVVTFGDVARKTHDINLCGRIADDLYQ